MKKQNNGFKIGMIVIFLGLTIMYLFPTIQWTLEQRHIEDMPEAEQVQYLDENRERLQSLQENSLSLGLDLQGGMYVTLEVGVDQLVLELAGDFADETLRDVIDVAQQRSIDEGTDFITEFIAEFESRDANAMLSRYYRSDTENITRRSTNEEVEEFLRGQVSSAVERAMEIVRSRVDRYGVTEPSILQQGNSRLVVELPGVDDEERVRNLLRGTARLEFRLTPNAEDMNNAKRQIINYFSNEGSTQADSVAADDSLANQQSGENPLTQVLGTQVRSEYVFGVAAGPDTARVNDLLEREEVQNILPRNAELMWGAQPYATSNNGLELFELIPVRTQIEMTGDVISEASVEFDPNTNEAQVSMTMDSEGARRWARITGANIGRPVAIVLDGYVYSYPNVITKINNGRSSITGLSGLQEAEDLVNILLSGALPAPLDIIEERTVGASLGEESIQAGFYSVLFGLIAVAIFMIAYYHAGGGIADLALILNIIFILGILAAFNATLTLPGIAGIVLTIGMAVDANVLIFDRIREELRAGKTLRAAIDNGYSNAMSAIVDANVTTFFVAVILFSFGVGPIKGFAITLMAGIASSLFSAIVITRVVVDYLTRDKTSTVSFG